MFLVLFFIASVIVFIRIAEVTFIVKIGFFELFSLYFYTLPIMMFFVIPLNFFVACALCLSRLSFDYELPVLFALGMSPKEIVKVFLPIAFLATFSLSILSLVLIPLSDLSYKRFLEERKNDINVNLQAGEFGQKLGNWLVYIEKNKKDENLYENIVLLSLGEERGLIFAKEAKIVNYLGVMEAVLSNGQVYHLEKAREMVERIEFQKLILRNSVGYISDLNLGVIEYWKQAFYPNDKQKKILRNFAMYVLISLFPLISLFYFPLLGIKNPRYQKNWTILQIMVLVGIFYGLVYLVANISPLFGIAVLPMVWFIAGYLGYKKWISRYY
ncbi:MAG: LptF/LptG family permease [Helicobacter sp.]|nr:LptF/LptG family permease [Helicobacter sp.]